MNEKVVNATPDEVVAQETEVKEVESVTDEVATSQPEDTKVEVQTKEENAKFKEQRIKYEAKAEERENALVKKLADSFGWEGITTRKELDIALEEQAAQKEAADKGLDVEVVKKMKKLEEENAKYRTQAEKTKQYQEFFEEFPNVDIKSVPQEVWTKFANGKNLTDAYTKYQLKEANKKLAELDKRNKADEVNQKNKVASTGSVADTGGSALDEINQATFDANRNDKAWIRQNFKGILKGRSKGLITH